MKSNQRFSEKAESLPLNHLEDRPCEGGANSAALIRRAIVIAPKEMECVAFAPKGDL